MKQSLFLLALLFTVSAARADFVIKQTVDNAMSSGESTIKIKGDKIRIDTPAGPGGQISILMDITTGDATTLIPAQKMMIKMSGDQMKQNIAQMQKMQTNSDAPKLTDTGKSETIAGYKAEIYSWTNSFFQAGGNIWLATNVLGLTDIKAQMEKMTKSPFGKMTRSMLPDLSKYPGIEVKTKSVMHGMATTTTLISAKQETLDASLFEIPKDYHEMVAPGSAPNFKPRPAPAQ